MESKSMVRSEVHEFLIYWTLKYLKEGKFSIDNAEKRGRSLKTSEIKWKSNLRAGDDYTN